MLIQHVKNSADLERWYSENGLSAPLDKIRALRSIMGVQAIIDGYALSPLELLSCFEDELLEIWDRRDCSIHRPVSEWSENDAARVRRIAGSQTLELGGAGNALVSCGSCGIKVPVASAFRCYYCGVWLCNSCGAEHFGGKRPMSFGEK